MYDKFHWITQRVRLTPASLLSTHTRTYAMHPTHASINAQKNNSQSLHLKSLFFQLHFTTVTIHFKQIKCDRLEPTCSSCIKYKATCLRTAFPAGAPLSTVSADAIGPGLRIQTAIGKRNRHYSESEVLDSCLRDVQALQVSRLRRIEQFFDRLGIDEKRLDEVSWIAEQIRLHEANNPSIDLHYRPEEVHIYHNMAYLLSISNFRPSY